LQICLKCRMMFLDSPIWLAGHTCHTACPCYERQRQLGRMVPFEMPMFVWNFWGVIYYPHQESHTSSAYRRENKPETTKNQTKIRNFGNQVTAKTSFRPEIQPSPASLFKKVSLYAVSAKPGALTFTILSNGNVVIIMVLDGAEIPRPPKEIFGGLFKF